MQKYCLLTKPQNISTGNLLKCLVFNIRSQTSRQIRALTHYFIYLRTAKRRTGQGRETSAGRQEKTTAGHKKGGGILPAGQAERQKTDTADTQQDEPAKALRRRKQRPRNTEGKLLRRKRLPLAA